MLENISDLIAQVINLEALIIVGLASFVVAFMWEGLKERTGFGPWFAEFAPEVRRWFPLVNIVASAVLVWLTALDMLPVFNAVLPWLGRAITAIIGGLGPSFVYNLWLDKPTPPTP